MKEKWQKCPVCDGRKKINSVPGYPIYGEIDCPICEGFGIIEIESGKSPKKLQTFIAEINDKSICKSCGQKMSLKSEPEYICINPECECYCKTSEARKATMKDLQADDEAREERKQEYHLICKKCGEPFWSNEEFPEPQICPSCYI